MAIYQLDDDIPRIADTAWVADSAQVIGRVELHEGASVWFGAVLRGDIDQELRERVRLRRLDRTVRLPQDEVAADLVAVRPRGLPLGHVEHGSAPSLACRRSAPARFVILRA